MTRVRDALLRWGAPGRDDFPANRDLSESVRWQLVQAVYAQTTTLIVGGAALTIAALVGWTHTHEKWFLAWASAIAVVTAARFGLDRAFRSRRDRVDRVRIWSRRFTVGAWAMGVLLGLAALVVNEDIDPFVRLSIISAQIVITMGAVTRNASCPVAAKGQVLIGLAPLLVACLWHGDSDHHVYFAFVVFEMIGALGSVRHLHRQAVRLMLVNEKNTALVSDVQSANRNLSEMNERLEAIATIDALTAIGNRRYFDDVIHEEVRRSRRDGSDVSLLIIDIDHFKGFNDRYGHQAGDDCLRRVAAALSAQLRRPADRVARWGGEEFCVILPATGPDAAAALGEELRLAVQALAISTIASPARVITVSIGVANVSGADRREPSDLVAAADEALYAAKAAGRNCVRVAAAAGASVAAGSLGELANQ